MKKQISLLVCMLIASIGSMAQNINTCAGTGSTSFNGDNIPVMTANVVSPAAVVFDQSGNMIVATGNRVRKISTSGVITTIAGTGVAGFTGDGGQAALAQLSEPRGLAIDGSGNIYIADNGNRRVRKIAPTGIITTYAGGGVGNDGVAANTASLASVQDIVTDPAGNLYIAEGAKHKVRKVNVLGIISTHAGSGMIGSTGDGGIALFCSFINPIGLAMDASGNLYVADSTARKVRMIASNSVVSTFAGSGVSGYGNDNILATTAPMIGPVKLCVKGNTVYISDSGSHRVRSVSSGSITAYAGTITPGFTGDGGPSVSALLDTPQGLTVDQYGNVVICDANNNRIRMIGCSQPSLSVTSSTITLCIGNQATLTATSGVNCTWQPGNITGTIAVISPTVNTTYSLSSQYFTCNTGTTITQAVMSCTTSTLTTGISEYSNVSKIKAYPNPFQDKITVEVDADTKYVEVIDLNGRLVMKTDVTGPGLVELNTESIAPGIYILKLVGYQVRTTKLLK